jgi:hypothetical protein
MLQLRDFPEHTLLPSDLSRQLQEVASNLEVAQVSNDVVDAATSRRRLTRELDRLVKLARTYPGCEDLLKPMPFEKLRIAATHGPIVILTTDDGSGKVEAIIIPSPKDSPKSVRLSITLERLAQVGQTVKTETRLAREADEHRDVSKTASDPRLMIKKGVAPRRGPDLLDLLWELWRGIVHPVVQALGLKVINKSLRSRRLAERLAFIEVTRAR